MTPGLLTDRSVIRQFILAGNAHVTLVSKKTGDRKTFHIEKAPEKKQGDLFDNRSPGYFVRLLTGPENTTNYRYLGFLWEQPSGLPPFAENGKEPWGHLCFKWNKEDWATDTCKAFDWFLEQINSAGRLDRVEVWHEGKCGRCGKLLTTPESCKVGLGPICQGRAA